MIKKRKFTHEFRRKARNFSMKRNLRYAGRKNQKQKVEDDIISFTKEDLKEICGDCRYLTDYGCSVENENECPQVNGEYYAQDIAEEQKSCAGCHYMVNSHCMIANYMDCRQLNDGGKKTCVDCHYMVNSHCLATNYKQCPQIDLKFKPS